MSGSDVIRKFERMLPGLAATNREFENDILADWRTAAERNRRHKEQQTSAEIAENMSNWWSILIGTYHYDFKNGTETYTPAPKKDKPE